MKGIEDWVTTTTNKNKLFKQAVHLILLAIARDRGLSRKLVIKGGMAMSIVYSSDRFTSDIDLSALDNTEDLSREQLEQALSKQLKAVVALSDYRIDLNIHSIKPLPKHIEKPTFPAYKATIGYADSTNTKAMKKLANKNAPDTVVLDISFNEQLTPNDIEAFKLDDKHHVLFYTIEQLVAEKYRSLLQQVVRNRNRRQDIYDIHYLLHSQKEYLQSKETRKSILEKFLVSSRNREIEKYLNSGALKDPKIKAKSLKDFDTLRDEIEVETSADVMYDTVQSFFESLPWDDLETIRAKLN